MTRISFLGGCAAALCLAATTAFAGGPQSAATGTVLSSHCSTVVLPATGYGSHQASGCAATGTASSAGASGFSQAGGCQSGGCRVGGCQAGGCQECMNGGCPGCMNGGCPGCMNGGCPGCMNGGSCPEGCQDCDCGCQDGFFGRCCARLRGWCYRTRKENYFCKQSFCTMYTAPVCPPYWHPSHGHFETCWRPFPHLPSRCPQPFLPAPYPESSPEWFDGGQLSEAAPAPEPAPEPDPNGKSPEPSSQAPKRSDYDSDGPMTRHMLVPPSPSDLKPAF